MSAEQASGNTDRTPPKNIVVCDELVEYVGRYMCLGYKKFALKRIIEKELNYEMSMQTYETLRSKARDHLKETLLTPEQHRINAVEMIYQIIQDEKTHSSTKLRGAEILLTSAAAVTPEQDGERSKKIREILAGIDASVPTCPEELDDPDHAEVV